MYSMNNNLRHVENIVSRKMHINVPTEEMKLTSNVRVGL